MCAGAALLLGEDFWGSAGVTHLVGLDDIAGDPTALAELDALSLGPLADLDGVVVAVRAARALRGGGGLAGPASRREEGAQGVVEHRLVRLGQVDLVLDPLDSEVQCHLRLAAVE